MITLLASAVPTGAHRVIDSVSNDPRVLPLVFLIIFGILGLICFLAMFDEPGAFFGLVFFAFLAWLIPFQLMTFTHKVHHRNDVIAVVVNGHDFYVPAVQQIDGSWVPEPADINGKSLGPPHIDPKDDAVNATG